MKIIFTTPTCTACKALKEKFKAEYIDYREIMIGVDIDKEEFFLKYPGVRTVPYVIEEGEEK